MSAGFREAVARAIWLDAYATAHEADELIDGSPVAGGGENWDYSAPSTPVGAYAVADRWIRRWESRTGRTLAELLDAFDAENGEEQDYSLAGHRWALASVGHGVDVDDDGAEIPACWGEYSGIQDSPTVWDLAPDMAREAPARPRVGTCYVLAWAKRSPRTCPDAAWHEDWYSACSRENRQAIELLRRTIDGAQCVVFRLPDGRTIAQTCAYVGVDS